MRGLWHGGLCIILGYVLTPSVLLALSDHVVAALDEKNTIGRELYGPLIDEDVRTHRRLSHLATDQYSVDHDKNGQAFRLGLAAPGRSLRYGMRHRAGDSAGLAGDQESREAWLGWQTRTSAVTTSIRHVTSNALPDSSQPGMTTLQKRFAIDLTPQALPTFTVAYVQGVSNSAPDPTGFTSTLNQMDVIETALTYQISDMNIRAGTEYMVTDDPMHAAPSTLKLRHGIAGSYSPVPPVTLTSAVSMTDERNHGSGERKQTPGAEVVLLYRARQDINVTLRSAYSRTYNDLGNVDLGQFNAKSLLSWDAYRGRLSTATFSFETAYSTTVDLLRATGPFDDLSAVLRMTVRGRSWSDWLSRYVP